MEESSLEKIASTDRMYYITDQNGNYYRVNGNNQLVIADSREDAEIFSCAAAARRIAGGKKSRFYTAVPIEQAGKTCVVHPADLKREPSLHTISCAGAIPLPAEKPKNEAGDTYMVLPYDLKNMDWMEYLTHLCYVASVIPHYQNQLNQVVSDLDMQICDIMHYVELYELDEEDSIRIVNALKECREQRRDVKDELFRIECVQRTLDSGTLLDRARESIKQMGKLDSRVYRPRKLSELFQSCPPKTVRDNKLKRAMEGESCLDSLTAGADHREEDMEKAMEKPEEEKMEYTRRETVFDGRKNDWLQLVTQQAEFFAQAEQYIFNLQADITDLDAQIEDTLRRVEDVNCNAAQGYMIFQHLKKLRTERKEKQTELQCLQAMTEEFHCDAMAEAFERSRAAVEEILCG